MRQRTNIIRETNRHLRLAAFLLLALISHALFTSCTHHHTNQPHEFISSTASVSQDGHTPEEHHPQSGHDTHCVTCQLQRDFASQVSPSVNVGALNPELASWEEFLCGYHSTEPFTIPAGRAPPLV
ncbi:MAG: DUF2946 family protein [Acidobacteriota bacterium]